MHEVIMFILKFVVLMLVSGVHIVFGSFLFKKGFNINLDQYIKGNFEFFVMVFIGAIITYFYYHLLFNELADAPIIFLIISGFPSILAFPITATIFRDYDTNS